VAVVGVPLLEKAPAPLAVDVHPLTLQIGPESAADLRSFIPVEPKPAHRLDRGMDVLVGHAGFVGVLNAKDKAPAGSAGICPAVDRRANVADVQVSAGRGREPDPCVGRVSSL